MTSPQRVKEALRLVNEALERLDIEQDGTKDPRGMRGTLTAARTQLEATLVLHHLHEQAHV